MRGMHGEYKIHTGTYQGTGIPGTWYLEGCLPKLGTPVLLAKIRYTCSNQAKNCYKLKQSKKHTPRAILLATRNHKHFFFRLPEH